MSTPVDARGPARERRRRIPAPGGPEKVGGARPARDSVRKRGKAWAFQTAARRAHTSTLRMLGWGSPRERRRVPLATSVPLRPRLSLIPPLSGHAARLRRDSASWEPSNRSGLSDWVLRKICPVHWTVRSPTKPKPYLEP